MTVDGMEGLTIGCNLLNLPSYESDTPTGKYKMMDWAKTGPGTKYAAQSYGINDILRLHYLSGEGGRRDGMHIHGGRNQDQKLVPTLGCIRINDDILLLKQLVELLYSIDDTESLGYVYVNDGLQSPVEYKDRQDVLDSVGYGGGEINPSIIQSYIYYPRLSFQSLYYEYLQNIESHNNVENE